MPLGIGVKTRHCCNNSKGACHDKTSQGASHDLALAFNLLGFAPIVGLDARGDEHFVLGGHILAIMIQMVAPALQRTAHQQVLGGTFSLFPFPPIGSDLRSPGVEAAPTLDPVSQRRPGGEELFMCNLGNRQPFI
jgi:hypothetical protein